MKKADRGLYQSGNTLYIRFADQNGEIQRESSGSKNKSVAKQLLSVRKGDVVQGKFKKVQKKEKVLFKDYSDVFLRWAKVNLTPNGYRRYDTTMNQLLAHFKKFYLDQIKRTDIERYKENRSEKVSNSTINRDLACMKKMYNNAIADEIVDSNPVKTIEFLDEPERSEQHLSEKEMIDLLNACDNDTNKTFVIVGLNTGMRLEELLSLRWDQVDFENNLITMKNMKNKKEDKIPMNAMVVEQLNKLGRKSEYVISKPDNTRYKEFGKQGNKVMTKAFIKKCTPHILRHTYATMLVKAGVDLHTVKELGRWSNLKLVMRYSHVNENDHRSQAVKKLESNFQTDTKGDTVEKNNNNSKPQGE
jgi:integrase